MAQRAHLIALPVVPEQNPLCDDCIHAAFSQFGVYCMMFHEDILDSHVAQECGAFEANPTSPTQVVESDPDQQSERILQLGVRVPYYGSRKQGEDLQQEIQRKLRVILGGGVEVVRL